MFLYTICLWLGKHFLCGYFNPGYGPTHTHTHLHIFSSDSHSFDHLFQEKLSNIFTAEKMMLSQNI